jgi:hypothetical protein
MAATRSRPKDASILAHRSAGVQARYIDAYRVAGTMNAFGQSAKIAGFIFAAVIFIYVTESMRSLGTAFIAGAVIGGIFFVIGIIVSAQGQMLKAVVDTAVNSSPFLDDNQRAATMSLSGPVHAYGAADDVAAARELEAAESEVKVSGDEIAAPFCYHCGAELAADARLCTACGKQL